MKISIIIPNWNGSEKLKKHLPEVLRAAKQKLVEEVIVVDDSSSDNSLETLKNFPEVIIIAKDKNSGFSSTVNLGVEKSRGDFVLLLNNDADLTESAINYLAVDFNSDRVFSVGASTGGFWSTGKFEKGFFWHGQGVLKDGEQVRTHQTLWVSGGSGLFRKSIWEDLGGLDELFDPFYEEDVDLGYRATKRGYINLWEPKALVNHYTEEGVIEGNFSKNKVSFIAQRNQLFFIWKNITSPKLIQEHKKALAKMLLLHPKYAKVFFAAFLKLNKILPKREIEKRKAKLSDEEILEIFN